MKDSKANRLGNYIFSKKTIDKMNDKIILLGNRNKITAQTVLIIRLVCSIFLFFVVLYISNFGYFFAPLITVLFYLSFVRVFIDSKIEKRRKILEKESIYFFEILTLSLEAGRNIKTFKEMDPLNIPWKDMGVDLVFECSGKFTNVLDAKKHITAGSRKV